MDSLGQPIGAFSLTAPNEVLAEIYSAKGTVNYSAFLVFDVYEGKVSSAESGVTYDPSDTALYDVDGIPLLAFSQEFGTRDYGPYSAHDDYEQIIDGAEVLNVTATAVTVSFKAGAYFGAELYLLEVAILIGTDPNDMTVKDAEYFGLGYTEVQPEETVTLATVSGLTPNTVYALQLVMVSYEGSGDTRPPCDLIYFRTAAA